MKIIALTIVVCLLAQNAYSVPLPKQEEPSNKDLSSLTGLLGQNTNLMGTLLHLTQGTDLGTIINIINLVNSIHQLEGDIHSIPAVLNETIASLGSAAGNITQVILQELSGKRDLSSLTGLLGQNTNLMGTLLHLTQGTDLGTIINIINLVNSIHQLQGDIHSIPAVLNETIASLGAAAGNITQVILQELSGKRDLSSLTGLLGQNTNLLGTLLHLTQGTDLGTIINIINLVNSIHQLQGDIHSIPAVLNETIASLGSAAGNITQVILQELSGKRDLSSLTGLLGQNTNLLGTLLHLTQGTDLGTIINIINLVNSIHQLQGDIHSIPAVLNETIASLGSAAGNITQVILQELSGKRDLSSLTGLLGQNTNLLGTLLHLTQGTDLGTIINIINLVNSIHQLQGDIHSIPAVLNETIASLGSAAGNITQVILQELSGKRDLSSLTGLLGQNTNLLGTLLHLTQGTDLGTIINIINLVNSIHQLQGDIHSIPAVLNETIASLGSAAGNITQVILQELSGKRDLSSLTGLLGQNTNLLGTLLHLTQGTDLGTIINIINLVNSIHQLQGDIHSIPAVLNETIASLGSAAGNITQVILQELSGKRDLSSLTSLLGQNTNLLGTLSHLTQGTDLGTIINIINLVNSIHQIEGDIHSIPAVLNQTIASLGTAAGNLTQIIISELSG